MKNNKRIIIIGGGPTGIGAAYHLQKLGYDNWFMYEKNSYLGGHSATHKDRSGFLWDEGGHVLFSHFKYYDVFLSEVLGKNFYRHRRESWVKMPKVWVPYPFQNNIRYLPPEDQLKCISELIKAQLRKDKKAANFEEWVYSTFGKGIAEMFMLPYNFKVWATPPESMSKDWIAERVSVVNVERILSNIINKEDDISWGPNNTFVFPKYGGTGEIYERGGRKFQEKIRLNEELVSVDFDKKLLRFRSGLLETYDFLISAVPIDRLIRISNAPVLIRRSAEGLVHNGIVVLGLGLKKKIKTSKCWVYFPDKETPFYRLTFFHNYSPCVVPGGDVNKYSSLMCEVSYSKFKKLNKKTIARDCIEALIKHGILNSDDRKKIVSIAQYDIPYGYPVPTLDRDRRLKKIQSYLLKRGIYSRGRYGAWKYEISNMDHCFMQGVEAVESILNNKKETIWSL